MTAHDLKPCPFCGSAAQMMGGPAAQEWHSVWCTGPGCNSRMNGTMDAGETADKWNRRTLSTITPAEVGGLVDAQTEARAIAQKLQDVVDGTDGWLNIDKAAGIIASTLAAKDAELAAVKVSNNKWLAKWERAEARLAKARKALDALDRMSRGVDWCDQDEQARRWSAARRVLTGGDDHG